MKRLVWLLLLAFGTLLTQVPAVEPLAAPAKHCACGEECGGRCGMRDCALPPAPAAPRLACDRSVTLVRPAAKRGAQRVEQPALRYFSVSLASLNARHALRAPASRAPAASVPLFRGHCSLLL
jgi:hypothetical protein